MRPLPLMLAASLALGCAHASPRRQTFQYPDFVMFRAEPWEVDQACVGVSTRNDSGEAIKRRVRCCWDKSRSQMWVGWDDVDCIPEELCHKYVPDRRYCDRNFKWRLP